MVRTEREYQQVVKRLEQEKGLISKQRQQLEQEGLDKAQIQRLMDPLESFYLQLQEEIQAYERLCRGELNELHNVRSIGHLLISARIARGLSQRELAQRLDVNESSISRDERNEYHNITLDRAARILEILGVAFHAVPELIPEAELAVS
jgi:ribosome-binding protein aMBF1 (putative translation factor)